MTTLNSLVPAEPDRSPLGRYEQKLDLANRLQTASDEWLEKGELDRADFYQDLAAEALAAAHELAEVL